MQARDPFSADKRAHLRSGSSGAVLQRSKKHPHSSSHVSCRAPVSSSCAGRVAIGGRRHGMTR